MSTVLGIFLWCAVIWFAFLFVVWSKTGAVNMFIKFINFAMAMTGLVLSLWHFGALKGG